VSILSFIIERLIDLVGLDRAEEVADEAYLESARLLNDALAGVHAECRGIMEALKENAKRDLKSGVSLTAAKYFHEKES
jgi:hypothetical protein